MAKLKVAVIGTSIGCYLHVRALKAAGFDVVALIGRDAERTAERAAHFQIPLASTSVADIIESDVDAVVVATPPATHHAISSAAIAAGKHVLCEKPLALTVEQSMDMQDEADAAGVVAVLQHQLRWRLENAMLRRLLAQGGLGEPIQGSFMFDFPMTQRQQPLDVPDWWLTPETGGGWLRNWNSHGIDLVRYMLGEFAAVSGRVHPDPARGMTSDDSYVFCFVLTNGMQGVMTGTCRSWDICAQTRIIGSSGTAVVERGELHVTDQNGRRRVEPTASQFAELSPEGRGEEKPEEGLPAPGEGVYQATHAHDGSYAQQLALCSAFRRRILDITYRNPALASFSDGVASLRVIEAVERSQREHRWIDLVH